MPLIIAVLLVISQSGYIVYKKNLLQQAAREGVRVVSTTNSNQRAVQAVSKVCGYEMAPNIEIYPEDDDMRKLGDIVTVRLSYDNNGLWNIVYSIMGKKIVLRAESSMRMECQ